MTLAFGAWVPPLVRRRNSLARRCFTAQVPVGAGSEGGAEGAVELGLAAKPRILQRLRHAAAGAFSMDFKESLQSQLAAVLLERNSHLGLEDPSQSRWTEAAGRGQLLEGIQGQIVPQSHCCALDGWMHFLKKRCLAIEVKVPGLQQGELKAGIV